MALSTFYGSFRRIMDEVSSNYTLFSRKNFFSKKVALYCDFLCHTTFTSLVCCQHRVLELFSIFLHKKHCISMEIALWSGVNGTKSFKNCSEKCTFKKCLMHSERNESYLNDLEFNSFRNHLNVLGKIFNHSMQKHDIMNHIDS